MFDRGTIIQDRYEIIEEVGSGGMSVVYKAKCHVLNRFVAIKVLKPEFSDDKSFVNKFRIEAQSAAGLSHPNIVNVYDVGEENGYYYIVMELVEGITLKEYIQQNGRLPYQTALDFITQIVAGIEVAHENHTIHRDIKPQNVIVSKNGTLKVTDFGIAKAATSNTVASSAMGSVHYISPEQARGGYSDERSDIYSLGITLYEMLTGRVPFEGENNVTVALMHIQSEIIPPREYYPDIPLALEKIVLKATQKKPERRYLTTNAMLADLRKVAMDPNANVASSNSTMMDNSPTVQITGEELETIKNASYSKSEFSLFPVGDFNQHHNDDYESLNQDEMDEEEDYYDEDDELRYDEEETSRVNPKLEKMITIGAISVTVIIAIIIIGAIVSLFKTFDYKEKEPSTTEKEINLMINVVGLKEEEAIEKLENKNIQYEIERKSSDAFDNGVVMRQSVNDGEEINEDTIVKLVISSGKEEIQVPDVVGKTAEEAKEILEDAGFRVEEDEEYDEEIEEDEIISQSPEAMEKVEEGSTVKIVISKGEEIKVAVVPKLKKKTISQAEKALTKVNLKLGNVSQEYSDSVEEGHIISQSIAAGTEVKEETEVDITISKGKKPSSSVYSAIFSGSITNQSYTFKEGELIHVTLVLKAGDATYTIIDDYFDEASLPIQLTDMNTVNGLTTKEASLVYSVKDENGTDITSNFSSSIQAKIKAVE